MDSLQNLPLHEIDPHALLRDRTRLDPEDLGQLQLSIATEGLRQPIEVWQLSTPRGPYRYGLISGLCRLTACTALGHTTIAAFLRTPASVAQAMAAMVSENEIRAPVSPWEKATLILAAISEGHFDTADAAVAALFPAVSRFTRARIRSHTMVVQALDGLLTAPQDLSTRQLDAIAAALIAGHEDLLLAALQPVAAAGLQTQWSTLRPVLMDIAREPTDPKTGRPRRLVRLRQGLTITREPAPTGWILRFSGPEARKGGLVDDVLDKVEEWFQKR
jgi:ParB family transcriptional regulator, chromosome partitioning protein